MKPGDLMRVSELAPLLGLTSGRVYQLLAAGEIPATRVGRAVRVPRPALDAWLQRCTAEAKREARQKAARRATARPEPATDTERAITAAVQAMAENHPFGWRGSATELLERLQEYRAGGEGDLTQWPLDGRSLSVALRRLVAHLDRKGVCVSIGHRGHRGKRLLSITRADTVTDADFASEASRHEGPKASPGGRLGSARPRADADGDSYTGYLIVEEDDDGQVLPPGAPGRVNQAPGDGDSQVPADGNE